MKLSSSVFEHNGNIPSKYTCDGENINPHLTISNVPENAQSLVLIMDDPDAIKPAGKVWDHWIIWNIPPSTLIIKENQEPQGMHGKSTGGNLKYKGPCPPDTEHRYYFKLYALDIELDLAEGSTKKEVELAMEGHILAQTELIGKYSRN
ncbi:MAG: YbhB/YbcL family Raf kinase inhibitor-like protein [Candidatus Woesearchaeota archaeon]